MIKKIFIPLVVLGESKGDLLELYIEPRWFKPKFCFEALTNYGLQKGIELAERAIRELDIKIGAGMVYSSNSQPELSNSLGTAVALVLASVLSLKQCPYQMLIVSAGLNERSFYLQDNGFWLEKLAVLLTLESQKQVVPLILAANSRITHEQKRQLLQRNIKPFLMETLEEAILFCLSNTDG